MKNHMASEWGRVLLWALAFECMLTQSTSKQDLEDGFFSFHCNMLPAEKCAFAVDAGGFRCVLKTALQIDGSVTYECQTLRLQLQLGSDMISFTSRPYIETDDCINACGLQRLTNGASPYVELLDDSFRGKLCSPKCEQNCGNIIDHYEIVLADQGEDLRSTCEYLTEYFDSERKQTLRTDGETSRRDSRAPPSSKKHNQILYEQASGPSSDRAPAPNSDS